MGSDESASFIYYASHPLSIALTIYGSPNNHILHSVLMHIAYRMFGSAEWALRLPAFLAGVAIVPLTYFAAQRGALIAAALTASAPVLIDYSTDARGYTMLCCFVLLCLIALQRNAPRTFALSGALGFFTIPVMIYPFEMLVAWGRRKAIRPAMAAIVIAAALYAPALIISGLGAITSNPYVRPLPFSDVARNFFPYLATVHAHLSAGIPIVVQILIAIGFLIGVRRQPIWIGLALVFVTVALQRVLPFPRVWLPFLVLAFITAAAAWPWERSEAAVAAALVIALAISGFTTERLRETGELRAVREIARELNVRAQPGDPLLALPPSEMPIAFYCHRVEVLHPDLTRPRLFVVENRDYGQSLARTLAFFKLDARQYAIRKLRDFGSSALYELRRVSRYTESLHSHNARSFRHFRTIRQPDISLW
jgi:Dolichyl-phosphate-mannose-protein mannosyltransferase